MAPTLSPASALRLQASMIFTVMAASSVPSPLYAVYRAEWGFSPIVLTAVFAVYAFSLLAALLTLGSLSDHLGRKPVVIGALCVEAISIAMFLAADSVGLLIAARLVQGAATGVAMSVLGAGVADLDRQRAPLVNSAAPLLGLGTGALISSLLATFAPAPLHLVYAVMLVLLSTQTCLATRLPETIAPRPGALRSMLPMVAVPPSARRAFMSVVPLNVAVWALAGFFLSLGSTLAQDVTGRHGPLVGGSMLAALAWTGGVASLKWQRLGAAPLMRLACGSLAAGVALVLMATHTRSTTLFFLGIVVAGVGFGLGSVAVMRTVMSNALPEQRASLMAALLTLSYFSMSLPALAAGAAVSHLGLITTAQVYGAFVMVLALAALTASLSQLKPAAAAR